MGPTVRPSLHVYINFTCELPGQEGFRLAGSLAQKLGCLPARDVSPYSDEAADTVLSAQPQGPHRPPEKAQFFFAEADIEAKWWRWQIVVKPSADTERKRGLPTAGRWGISDIPEGTLAVSLKRLKNVHAL